MLVTEEIRFFMENILNTGNLLGLDRATLMVYLAEGVRNDDEPDILLHVDSYTILGGFLEALILKMIDDAKGKSVGGVEWIIQEYKSFVENIKDYEKKIIKHTKRYYEKINNIADLLRILDRRVKVHLSEISTGVELYFSGRYEIMKNHISRKINELSAEGISDIVVTSPFEYSLYQVKYASQISTWPFKLVFFPELIKAKLSSIKPVDVRAIIFEPYMTPVSMFSPDLREYVLEIITRIDGLLGNIRGVKIVDKLYDGMPIGYEQLWMINPIITVNMARSILEKYQKDVDVFITVRTSTAMMLNVTKDIYEIDTAIYDYADFVSRILLGRGL